MAVTTWQRVALHPHICGAGGGAKFHSQGHIRISWGQGARAACNIANPLEPLYRRLDLPVADDRT